MANLIIKSSADNLVLQGSDASPAITVAADGQTTFAEAATMSGNVTMSGTANNIGTVTAGTIETSVTKKISGFSAYLSTAGNLTSSAWVEASNVGTWTERWDSSNKYAAGRYTPTVQGIYLVGYAVYMQSLDDNEYININIRKNGSVPTGGNYGWATERSTANSDLHVALSGSSIVQLDTDDYVSMWAYHTEGAAQGMGTGNTEFWGYYVGTV